MFATIIVVANIHYLFNPKEIELGVGQLIDHTISVRDVLATMWIIPILFKILTNFTLPEFEELAVVVVPIIKSHVRSIGDAHIICW